MEFLKQRGLLRSITPLFQTQRYRGKINIQRPRQPHFERALFMELCKPIFPPKEKPSQVELCIESRSKKTETEKFENPFKLILAKECLDLFNNSKMVAIFHENSIKALQKRKLYVALKKENMKLSTYGHAVLSKALKKTGHEATLRLFTTHNIIVFSSECQINTLTKILKKYPQYILLAGIVDGRLLNRQEFLAYGQLPDLQTSRAQFAQLLLSAGSQLTGHLNYHQNILVSHIQSYAKSIGESKEQTIVETGSTGSEEKQIEAKQQMTDIEEKHETEENQTETKEQATDTENKQKPDSNN